MNFTKLECAFFVLIGLSLATSKSYGLEVCSQKSCEKAESQSLQTIAENLNRIFGFLQQGDYIQLCKSNPEMTKCVSSDISHLILGGLVLPMRGKINGYKVERIGDEISFTADAGKLTTCAKSDLEFSIENSEIILKNKSKYYCNWAAVGNVMSYTELKLKKIYLDKLHFYGEYKISAFGTAVGSGTGTGSFQVTRGDSLISAVEKKYGPFDLFNDLSVQEKNLGKKINVKKNDGDQLPTDKPTAVYQKGDPSEKEMSIIQESRPENLDKQDADFLTRDGVIEDKDASNAKSVSGDRTAGERVEPAKESVQQTQNQDLSAEKRSAPGKSMPTEKRSPTEKRTLSDKRSPSEKRSATEKARVDTPMAEKRPPTEKAETESQSPERTESGRSSSVPPSKNEVKPTKPTVKSIMDL